MHKLLLSLVFGGVVAIAAGSAAQAQTIVATDDPAFVRVQSDPYWADRDYRWRHRYYRPYYYRPAPPPVVYYPPPPAYYYPAPRPGVSFYFRG